VLSVASVAKTRPPMERSGISQFVYSLPADMPGELGRKMQLLPTDLRRMRD
jgi:hypothetical protein